MNALALPELRLPQSIVVPHASRAEWLAFRESNAGIGGSDVSTIMGVNPWQTPWQLWYNRKHGSRQDDNAAMQRGRRWESRVIEDFAEASGRHVVHGDQWSSVPGFGEAVKDAHSFSLVAEDGWRRATLDGAVFDGDAWGLLEAKTSSRTDGWGTVADQGGDLGTATSAAETEGLLPPAYTLQVYWYLGVTGLPYADVAVMLPRPFEFPEVRWVRVLPDEQAIGYLVEAVAEWRERHLIREEPPAIDGTPEASEYVTRTFDDSGDVREATKEEADLIAQYHFHKTEAATHESRKQHLRNALFESMSGHSKVVFTGGRASISKPSARTTVNLKRLQAEFPDAFAACSEMGTPSRRLTVKLT